MWATSSARTGLFLYSGSGSSGSRLCTRCLESCLEKGKDTVVAVPAAAALAVAVDRLAVWFGGVDVLNSRYRRPRASPQKRPGGLPGLPPIRWPLALAHLRERQHCSSRLV